MNDVPPVARSDSPPRDIPATPESSARTVTPPRTVVVILLSHAALFAAWWYAAPRGFPVGHPRWWVNEALPPVIVLACAVGVYQIARRRSGVLPAATVLALAAMWCSLAVAVLAMYPRSARLVTPATLLFGILMLRSALRFPGRSRRLSATLACLGLGLAVGAAISRAQRAPHASTHPLNLPLQTVPRNADDDVSERPILFDNRTQIWPRQGNLQTRCGSLQLSIEPMLRFHSRSPDGFWTSLAHDAGSPRTMLVGKLVSSDVTILGFDSDFRSTLRVAHDAAGHGVEIEAAAALSSPIYSHLNSYTTLLITGHRRLSLVFSPCPNTHVEIFPSDYPVGRPARAAYLGADGNFRVVEATSAEKGPFHVLAEGPLQRNAALSVVLFDEDKPMCRITWRDWAAQASTDLSPTAGWGLPANAIEFSLIGDRPDDGAALYMTLAGTSLGRGWDSVGHAAGTYWNRMSIEKLADSTSKP